MRSDEQQRLRGGNNNNKLRYSDVGTASAIECDSAGSESGELVSSDAGDRPADASLRAYRQE